MATLTAIPVEEYLRTYYEPDMEYVDGQLVERKVLSVLSGSSLLECFVSEVLDSGRYKRHVDQVRARLARMRRDARAALESAGITFDGGIGEDMFLWGRLPDSTPIDELVRRAREQSIILAKGALFSPTQTASQWLRFNVAYSASAPLVRFLSAEVRATASAR